MVNEFNHNLRLSHTKTASCPCIDMQKQDKTKAQRQIFQSLSLLFITILFYRPFRSQEPQFRRALQQTSANAPPAPPCVQSACATHKYAALRYANYRLYPK